MSVQLKEKRTSKDQKPSAGPSADDRFGSGAIASNLKARIIKNDVVGGRTMITIASGTERGVHAGMEGFIETTDGTLATFQIHETRPGLAYAFVEVTIDQIAQLAEKLVVVNPIGGLSKQGVAVATGDIRARIIGKSVHDGRVRITIAGGSVRGITRGMQGHLISDDGREGESITISSADWRQAYATVSNTLDHVSQHPNVVIKPKPAGGAVQRRASGAPSTADVQSTAQAGVADASSRLPHFDAIQRSFGKHDVSGVRAQVGGAAASASEALGAQAYATGNTIAFASTPDLHTAAHEAAHTIQQQRGTVGFQALGAADDGHERHADAVADAVVAGGSAESLLDELAGGNPVTAVQRKPDNALPGFEGLQPLRWTWSNEMKVDAEVGQRRDFTVQVWNDDASARVLRSIHVTGAAGFKVHAIWPTSIPARSSAKIVLTFEPTIDGVESGILTVEPERGPGATMSLIGHGTPKPTKAAKPEMPSKDVASPAKAGERMIDNSANRWNLAAPDKIDLGDHVVDRRTTHRTSIFAIDRDQGPRVRVKLQGDPSIKLLGAPSFLPGTRGAYDETKAFEFEHKPTSKGEVANTLDIEIMDAPHETFRYPVVAAAHVRGEPTLAEQRDATEKRTRERRDADCASAERVRVEKAIAKEDERDTHYHRGHLSSLGKKRDEAKEALSALYLKRLEGIEDAYKEIGDFVRQRTIVKPSLLEQLALLALDVATASIAGGLAKRLETALSAVLKMPAPQFLPHNPRYPRSERVVAQPSKAIAAMFTDGLKESIKKGVKVRPGTSGSANPVRVGGDRPNIGRTGKGETFAMRSSNPKVAFFAALRDALIDEKQQRANELASFTHEALLPTLKVDHKQAWAAMDAVTNEIQADNEDARGLHAEQGVRKWVQYVAETSSDESAWNRRFDDKHRLKPVDGLIDITIKPESREPGRPIEVSGARLNGVKRDVVTRFADQPLIDVDLHVRASGHFDNSPGATLTILRRSGGEIDYTENRLADSDQTGRARWLERKAFANGRGHDAEWGARILLEKEIMTKPLSSLVDRIDNDSEK